MTTTHNEIKLNSASVALATDWDNDGDLDLLIGNIQGQVGLCNASRALRLDIPFQSGRRGERWR